MQTILVALDGSAASGKALPIAADLARARGARLVLLHVMAEAPLTDAERRLAEVEYIDDLAAAADEGGGLAERDGKVPAACADGGSGPLIHYSELARRFRRHIGERILRDAQASLADMAQDRLDTRLAEGDPAATILDLARTLGVSMVVMGSRGLGEIRGMLLGSVSHKVAHQLGRICVTIT